MTRWRLAVGLIVLLAVGLPLAMPFRDLLARPHAWRALGETERLLALGKNTLFLVTGTLALSLPVGVFGAALLYRTDLPLRRLLRFLTVLTLFVPLPLFASGWQAALGTGGWLPVALWSTPPPGDPDLSATGIAWKPWAQGLGAAIWVHAVAGLPWVILLAGQGFRWVERELEEDALTVAAPWRVFRHVTLPRSRAALCAAALWVALQTATEITITDMMQLRTFAEEVYNQLVRPDPGAAVSELQELEARAVAVSMPAFLLTWILILGVARWLNRSLPPLGMVSASPYEFRLGWARWPALASVFCTVGVLVGVPVASLVWKAGLNRRLPPQEVGPRAVAPVPDGEGPAQVQAAWSPRTAWHHVVTVLRARGKMVAESLLLAALAGGVVAGLALLVCWLAVEARWFQFAMLSLMAAAWALPGPVVGLGLKGAISWLIDRTHSGLLAVLLYYGPSPAPVVWAYLLRFFPCAVALLWPVVRLLPVELRDSARVDGATPAQEFRYVVWPLFALATVRTALAVAVLSLGELSAGKLVEPPGSEIFAHKVFDLMHFGITNDLAALCLVLLTFVLLGGALVALLGWISARNAVSSLRSWR